MLNLRPHHVVCLTKLYDALYLFTYNKEQYYDAIKEELKKNANLRVNMLDNYKYSWGTIYSHEVMNVLASIITEGCFITQSNTCDSICSSCYGHADGKCVGENRIQIMDKLSTNILGLKQYTKMHTNLLKDKNDLNLICNLCGTKEKCLLIRRAVNNIKVKH